MTTVPRRSRPDLGRLLMIPAAAVMLVLEAAGLAHRGVPASALQWLGLLLVCAFYTLIIWCYLRRGPALATSGSVTGHIAAIVATWSPLALPLLRGTAPGPGQQGAADVLLLAGLTWSVWSLRFLGPSFSVIPQARDVVDRGPYRWVRHPLYLGEIVSSLGLAVAANAPGAIGVWLGLCGLQAYRAVREEQILLRTLPGYSEYRRRTSALIPGFF